MNVLKAVELIGKFANCPQCGNDKIGNGDGELNIDDYVFRRKCKCGFELTIDTAKDRKNI